MKDAPIKQAMPAARPRRCYINQNDIVIPAGTIFRQAADQRGGKGFVEAIVGHGPDFASCHVVQVHPDAVASGAFREVEA